MNASSDDSPALVLTVDDLRRGAATSEIEAVWIAEVERLEAELEITRRAHGCTEACQHRAHLFSSSESGDQQ